MAHPIPNIDFEADRFTDILERNDHYHPYAYALLMTALREGETGRRHFSAQELLDCFRELTLDEFGPLSYTVLNAWNVKSCRDIGQMMGLLVETGRVQADENDSIDDFTDGFNFEDEFLRIYEGQG